MRLIESLGKLGHVKVRGNLLSPDIVYKYHAWSRSTNPKCKIAFVFKG